MSVATSVYIATILDGSINWLMEASATVPLGEDCGYAEFMSTIDVLMLTVRRGIKACQQSGPPLQQHNRHGEVCNLML